MSDETKQRNAEYDRWEVTPDFRKFLLTIVASFVGCLVAICLYYAAIAQPVSCSMPAPRYYDYPMYYGGDYAPECPYKQHKMKPVKKAGNHTPASKPAQTED